MVKVLDPFRHFTKWAQLRNAVTLAYLPEKVEKLLDEVSFDAIDRQLRDPTQAITVPLHALQARLIAAVKARFGSVFLDSSLALAARFLLPGRGRFRFKHFPSLGDENLQRVIEHLADDYIALLPSSTSEPEKAAQREVALKLLPLARTKLDELPSTEAVLSWWPRQAVLTALFPLAKMLFAVPCSSSENERSFSSAGFTLGVRRSRTELNHFRAEHRIRRFFTAGADSQSQAGREARRERVERILIAFSELLEARAAQPAPGAEQGADA